MHKGIEHPGLTDAEADALDSARGGTTGGGGGDQVGREFIIDDQGTVAVLTFVPGIEGTPTTRQPGFGLQLPTLGTPGAEGRLVFVDPNTGQIIAEFRPGTYRSPGLNQLVEIDAAGDVRSGGTRSLPLGGSGSSGGRTFEQERQLRREADAQQLKLRRLSDAQNITRDFISLQGRANEIVGETFGEDPFRGAILSQGAVPRGRSPVETFIQRLRELGGAEIPAPLSADESLPMIEERISGLEGLVTPGLPRAPLGMAHGGTVRRRGGRLQARPLAGGDEAQANLRPGTAVLVGEGPAGEGIRNNTAEVAEFMQDGSVRFIPLRAAAAHGGTVDIDDPNADATLTAPTNAPLTPDQRIQALQGAGIGAVRTGPRHFFGQFRGTSAETFERLGTRPALVQAAGTGEFFFRTPTGELQKIGGLAEVNAQGLNSFDAVVMDLDEIQQLGEFRGERFTEPPPAPGGSFSERPVPLFVPLDVNDAGLPDQSGRGLFLPAPEKLAAIWRNLGPDVQLIARSTYKMAGMSEAEFDRRINFFTPGRAATLTPQPARFA